MKKIIVLVFAIFGLLSCELFDAAGELAEFTVTAIEYTKEQIENND